MQDIAHPGEGLLGQVMDRIKQSARVELVYGESREIGEKTIIPIAAVAYMFGAGSGSGVGPHSGNGASEETAVGAGGGGGGAVRVQPVGVLEVSGDDTRLVPVIDWTRIITTGLTVFGAWMILRTIFRRR
ncbi:MAG: spore germination protein GerW family protein [Dehalococcoidia bacterium]|nr:spore germination protein GerW family protein [Dehalococcoidia bacterium]